MDIKKIKSIEVMPDLKVKLFMAQIFTWVYWEIEKEL